MSNIEHVSASEVIDEYVVTYGKYVISEMFPNVIDSLKAVIRRSLWCLRNTNKDFIASQDALGRIFKLHPHSPDATYQSIIRLTQHFSTMNTLFELKGDEGTYSGDKYASYRYTDIKISEFAYDVFFKDVDVSALTYMIGDDLSTFEPKYLVPKLPMALLLYNHCIGFGFTSIIPSYDLVDVRDLIYAYIECKNNKITKDEFDILANKLLPVFPIENNIINKNPVTLEGKIEFLTPYSFFLKNIPFSNDIVTIKKKLLVLMKNGVIEEFKLVSNRKEEANILIIIKNNKDAYSTFFRVLKTIGFTMKFNPVFNFSNNNYTINLNKFNLLESWFNERRRLLVSQINNKIISIKRKIREIFCYLLISDDVDYVISTIKNNDHDVARNILKRKFNISLNQSNIILNTPLKTLSRNNKKELDESYKNCIELKNKYMKSITSIDDIIMNDVDVLTNKYKRKAFTSHVPKYKGYISIDNNLLIQYESDIELAKLLDVYKNKYVNVFDYKINAKYVISYPSTLMPVINDRKYRLGYRYLLYKNNVMFIRSKNKSYIKEKPRIDMVNSTSIINNYNPVIYLEGKYIRKDKLANINISSKIYHMENIKATINRIIIVSFNVNIKNKIRFQYIETQALPKPIISSLSIKNTKILGIIDYDELLNQSVFLNIPFCYSEFFNKSYCNITKVSDNILNEPYIEKFLTSNIKI